MITLACITKEKKLSTVVSEAEGETKNVQLKEKWHQYLVNALLELASCMKFYRTRAEYVHASNKSR